MTTFHSFNLASELVQAVDKMGFVTPTPIQALAIPFLLENDQDILAQAQTGTGKTAAFGLPLLQRIDTTKKQTQGLILCPTRELCLQITKEMEAFSRFRGDIRTLAVYGGSRMETQIKALKKGVHIIVATPGRLLDLSRRSFADLSKIDVLVLDEADEMLNMGFKEELDALLATSNPEKQTWLFSATLPREVKAIASNYMRTPEHLSVQGQVESQPNIEHLYYLIHAKDRYLALKRVADLNPKIYGIVFCRTRQDTKDVAKKLMEDGYNADAIHGDLSQAQREQVMERFRGKHIQMLVATDVAARGLDVERLTHVIHYHLPDDAEVFTHRSGRTARAGQKGTSIVLAHLKEKGRLANFEKKLKIQFSRQNVPTGKEICETQLMHFIDRMKQVDVDHAKIDPFLPVVYEKLGALDREAIIKHFVSLEFNRFLDYYRDARDLNVVDRKKETKTGNGPKSWTKLVLSLGKRDGLTPGILLNYVNNLTYPKKIDVGQIDIQRGVCFFQIDPEFEKRALQKSKKQRILNRVCPLRVFEEQENRKKPNRAGKRKKRRPN